MTINVNGKIIRVESSFDKVYDRLKQFDVKDVNTKNRLLINEESIIINIDEINIEINAHVNPTDIYPIINNVIAYCVNNKNNLYIHSVVISKNKRGIMILGDFNSGKSTLARVAKKYGYEINSADQTWIYNDELVLGSRLNVIDNDITYIDDYLTNAVVKIEKIIILKGICTNGKCSVTRIENDNYYIKNLFKYSNWHYDMPLLTKYIKLIDTGEEILEFLRHVKIPTFVVRGDENRIMEVIDDRKEGIE